ncbi:gfo/Idh/MocA family oxidoreductase [Aureimonas flava]|uniref:Gfo/Idh/MocA family oxidoreductase n=1 Tax=Aureimonas flava TaxID=2320271 RepID=A0A3A1WN61_9HYPH|nr:Gfo/Idh/MocA family oxidoreductase [Aureimonas flava]RIY03338.1 gfo/Idh/MocA family oxidoreductase [Aureimonas flava]
MTLRVAIVGLGKIARDQHVPSIAAVDGVELTAVASRNASLPGVACFATLDEMLERADLFDAVALCTPPQVRHGQALAALSAGKHVLLEKPPGATVSEVAPLVALARRNGVVLFATWHSRFAPAVEPARTFLASTTVRSVRIEWKEDVRKWHPGQEWIWEPGGLGVFDPGINALSIMTAILPRPVFLTQSDLFFPANRAAPIAASLAFADGHGVPVAAEFDWRETSGEIWNIVVETDAGTLTVADGGKRMRVDGALRVDEPDREYAAIYRRFAGLAADGAVDVDLSPLQHVADAFLLGRRRVVDEFVES